MSSKVRRIVIDWSRKTPKTTQTVWCGLHDAAPGDCAELHHPLAYSRNR
jgi:hypothetical protein